MSQKRMTTSVMSFSCDLDTLTYLDDYCREHGGISMSQAVRYHLKMGRTYLKILNEQTRKVIDDANEETN